MNSLRRRSIYGAGRVRSMDDAMDCGSGREAMSDGDDANQRTADMGDSSSEHSKHSTDDMGDSEAPAKRALSARTQRRHTRHVEALVRRADARPRNRKHAAVRHCGGRHVSGVVGCNPRRRPRRMC